MKKSKQIPQKKRIPVDNRVQMKPLRLVKDDEQSKEDTEKIPILKPLFRKNRFFKGSSKNKASEHPQEEENAAALKPRKSHITKLNFFFRSSRFFKNEPTLEEEENTQPTPEPTKTDKHEAPLHEQEIETLEPAHASDGKSGVPEVSELLNAKDEWIDLEDAWGKQRRIPPLGWFVVLALIICSVGGWTIYDVMKARVATQDNVFEKKILLKDKEQEDQEVRDLLGGMQDCARGYLAANNVDSMLPFVRHPERVGPLMREYYKSHQRWRRKFKQFNYIRSLRTGTRSLVYVMAEAKEGPAQHLFLEQFDDGSFRVDWESDVIYQPIPWKDYLTKRPLAPLDMRVLVQSDDFYGFAFRDSDRYQCYKLTTIGSDDFLFGYVERGSPEAIDIEKFLSRLDKLQDLSEVSLQEEEEKTPIHKIELSNEFLKKEKLIAQQKSMILSLRFLPDDPSKQCVLIESIKSERWIYDVSP